MMQRARAAITRGLGALASPPSSPVIVDDALVMGLFYACQTDLTVLAPATSSSSSLEGDMDEAALLAAHMEWVAGAPHLGEGGSPFFSVCSLLPPELLEAMEAREDRENYHTRGYGLPATRWVSEWVWG